MKLAVIFKGKREGLKAGGRDLAWQGEVERSCWEPHGTIQNEISDRVCKSPSQQSKCIYLHLDVFMSVNQKSKPAQCQSRVHGRANPTKAFERQKGRQGHMRKRVECIHGDSADSALIWGNSKASARIMA